MVHILSINLKNNKKVQFELRKILGLGKYQVLCLCNQLNIGIDQRFSDLTQAQLYLLLKQIENQNLILELQLSEQQKAKIFELIEIKSYKSLFHLKSLSIRKNLVLAKKLIKK